VIVTVIVGILNLLGALLPQLPGLIDSIKGHPELNDGGKAVLAALDSRIAEHERKADETAPLPVPVPQGGA
jgi:hypothetical protein